jgi:hypothetical protein
MDTPSPASTKAQSHRKQKVIWSHEILVKRRQHVAANGELKQAMSSPPPLGMTVLSPSPPSVVAVIVDSPTVVLPNAITPATTRGKKRSSGDRLTNRTHAIRRRKGIVLDDARILGFLREPFTSVLKSSGKPMIDAKGLKRVTRLIAISN